MENIIKFIVGAGGASASFLFGGWSDALVTLGVFALLDFATGFAAAAREGKLNSEVGFWGIPRKVLIFVIVAVANLADQWADTGHMFRDGAVAFYIANEVLSIIENAGRMGVPVPPKVQEMIEVLKGKGERGK